MRVMRFRGRPRYLTLVAALLAVAGALAWTLLPASSASSSEQGGSWRIPVMASPTIAHQTEDGDRSSVSLTIDDGPDPTWTPRVLAVLKKHGVHATFCMIGPQAKAHPKLVRKVVAAGHRLCDHTVSHDVTMDHKSAAYQERQILRAQRMIEHAAGGEHVRYYRAPGGAFTPHSRHLAAKHRMRPLGWNVDSKDFERPGVDTILATVKRELPSGPTLLFHDGGGDRSQTVQVLKRLLPWLKSHGHTFSFPTP